jgi:hypothetical protein
MGGTKIEGNVIVKEKGCENLSHIERKLFEIDKIQDFYTLIYINSLPNSIF